MPRERVKACYNIPIARVCDVPLPEDMKQPNITIWSDEEPGLVHMSIPEHMIFSLLKSKSNAYLTLQGMELSIIARLCSQISWVTVPSNKEENHDRPE